MAKSQDKLPPTLDCIEGELETIDTSTNGFADHLFSLIGSQKQQLSKLFSLVLLSFVTAGLQFVTMVKIANIWGKAAFGDLAYAMVIGTYGAVIVQYGLNRTFVRDLIHFPSRFGELVAASLVLRSLILALVFLGLIGWNIIMGPNYSLSWGMIAIVIAVCMVSLNLQAVYDVWDKMVRHAVYKLLQRSVYFVIVWTFIVILPHKLSITLIGVAMLLSALIGMGIEYYWAISRIKFDKSLNILKTMADMAKNNIWVSLAAVGCLSFTGLNQLILKHVSGSAELGGYSACWQIVLLATLLLNQIARIGRPAMARYTDDNSEISAHRLQFLLRYSGIMLVVAACIGLPSILFPKIIIGTLFRPEYISEAGTLRVLGAYIIIFSVGIVASQYVLSVRMEKTYFASVIVGGCLSVVLCFILIPKFSTLGASISLLIAHGISMGLYLLAMISDVHSKSK
jgi:O-antigen/teichoic acid export membrane protein